MDLKQVLDKYGIKRCWAWCGDGWVPLIDKLIQDCIAAGWNKELLQVKEKFGGLRFYIGGASDEVHDLVTAAEDLSFKVCEVCGDAGEPRDGGWIKTLCDACFKGKKRL